MPYGVSSVALAASVDDISPIHVDLALIATVYFACDLSRRISGISASSPLLVDLLAASCTLIPWNSQDTDFTIQFLDTKRT